MITTEDITQYSEQYANAYPYAHVILDGLFRDEDLKGILEEWPDDDNPAWQKKKCPTSWKWHISHMPAMGPKTQTFLQALCAPEFIADVEKLSGIPGLYRDPYMEGSGLHFIPAGGYLKMHVDFNWQPQLKKVRRINFLIYLNDDWTEEDGGKVELWEPSMDKCGVTASPVFNRTVIFNTTEHSYHGHPDPCKTGRKSVAIYYYTSGVVKQAHSTLYVRRP